MKITLQDTLRASRKASRETTHLVKPMVVTDKRKQKNKLACRSWKGDC
jgi:hypothetical protein